ncbi:hypothetical protein I3842_02G168100 [Carya illinoinensis]|uniref:Nodulin-like domain-containing protein n=1 Tax=Carya illinoinensis TaxID=32201 RepID=A0A922FWW6_CARIL|nr:hypothetical protein I3842_02G168100 [Carya illinoinensis]
MDNLGQLGLSFGYSRADISMFASLISIWIYFGKILGGSCGADAGLRRRVDMKGLTLQVITGRWFVVFASFLIMSAAGATYMFGLYSNEIKSVLAYDQTTLNMLSFFKDVGTNVGILSGLINEVTPPWVVLSLGAVLNFFGYFMIWLSVIKRIATPMVWHMCLYICIGATRKLLPTLALLSPALKTS